MGTFNYEIGMYSLICISCGIAFAIPIDFREKRQGDHKTFYCPNGHEHHLMKKHNGWVFKNKWGSLLLWTIGLNKKDVKREVPNWREWLKQGYKIVKVKLVEVK